MSHQAAFIPEKGQQIAVSSTPTPKADGDSVLIRTKFVAINPVDHVIQDYDIFGSTYPLILGSDIAGEVVEVGPSVTTLAKGDRVLAAPDYLLTRNNEGSGFQEFVKLPTIAVTKIPDSMSFADASVLPLSVATAAAGLYGKGFLGLPLPTTSPKPTGQKILIWGGASSVGSSAVQLAVASGLEVLVTASPKNFDYVKNLAKGGTVKLFDYNSPSVVGDITAELQEGFAGAYDSISQRDTWLACATVVAQLGGGKIAGTLSPPSDEIPATVEANSVFAPLVFAADKEVGEGVFQDFLPKALQSGQFVAAPKPEIAGKGLDKIQDVMNQHKKGVSAKKLVVEL